MTNKSPSGARGTFARCLSLVGALVIAGCDAEVADEELKPGSEHDLDEAGEASGEEFELTQQALNYGSPRHVRPLRPILECIDVRKDGKIVAHWGYHNENSWTIRIPYSILNGFTPDPDDRDQPRRFRPGRRHDVFTTTFTGSSLTWNLALRKATADKNSKKCSTPKCNNDKACNDGNACNGVEKCVSGLCKAGTALKCDDGKACTEDTCDPKSGCKTKPISNGGACDDKNACTTGEKCAGGDCKGGTTKSCDDSNVCTADSCDKTAGCKNTAVADGTACPTGKCAAGVCKPVTTDCNDNNVCTTDTKNADGSCTNAPVANGSPCGDGNACNGTESCQAGVCAPGTAPVCNDNNPCTTDSCNMTTGCVTAPASGSCSDGNACNGAETCGGGTCNPGTPPVVDDGNACTTDACDAAGGVTHLPVPNDTPCGTGSTCQAGVCTPVGSPCTGKNCNDNNACTADSCDATTGNCVNTAVPAGTECKDADLCNGTETCQGTTCSPGTPLTVDDGNPCTADTCSATGGVAHTNLPDDTVCGTDQSCKSGVCTTNTPACAGKDCNDNNPCTADSCTPATGACVNTAVPAGTECKDANVCNGTETCQGTTCSPGTTLPVDDSNPCTADACDPVTGVTHTPVMEGASCSDGNACNGAETCQTGVCQLSGSAPVVDDSNPCTADACTPAGGVTHTPVANGTSCADADLCDGAEVCTAGVCGGGTPVVCNTCPAQTCTPATGTCTDNCTTPPCTITASNGVVINATIGAGLAVGAGNRHFAAGSYVGTLSLGGACAPVSSALGGRFDIYVAAYDGTNCAWVRSFGNSDSNDLAAALTVTGSGDVVLAGSFSGDLDFQIPNPDEDGVPGTGDEFVSPLTAAATQSFLAIFDGATGASKSARQYNLGTGGLIQSLSADPRAATNTEFVVGATHGGSATSTNVWGCTGAAPAAGGGQDVLLARMGTTGGTQTDPNLGNTIPSPRCVFQRRFGGAGDQAARSVAVDSDGEIAVAGIYKATFTVPGGAALPAPAAGAQDLFVFKLSSAAAPVHVWSRGFGDPSGPILQTMSSVAFSDAGDVVFGGAMIGTINFGGGITLTSTPAASGPSEDALVAKLDGAAGTTAWATRAGSDANSQRVLTVVATATEAIVGGEFLANMNFAGDSAGAPHLLTSAGAFDAFVVKLGLTDGKPTCSKRAGDDKTQGVVQLAKSATGVSGFGKVVGSLDFGGNPLSESTGTDVSFWLQQLAF